MPMTNHMMNRIAAHSPTQVDSSFHEFPNKKTSASPPSRTSSVFDDITATFYSPSQLPLSLDGETLPETIAAKLETSFAGLRFADPDVERDYLVFWNQHAHPGLMLITGGLILFCLGPVAPQPQIVVLIRMVSIGVCAVIFTIAIAAYHWNMKKIRQDATRMEAAKRALSPSEVAGDESDLIALRKRIARLHETRELLVGFGAVVAVLTAQISATFANHKDCVSPDSLCYRSIHPRQVCVIVACAAGTMRCMFKVPILVLGALAFLVTAVAFDPVSQDPPPSWTLGVFMCLVSAILVAFTLACEWSARRHFERVFRTQVSGRKTVAKHRYYDAIARCALQPLVRRRAAEVLSPDGITLPVLELHTAIVVCEIANFSEWSSYVTPSLLVQLVHAVHVALDRAGSAMRVDKLTATANMCIFVCVDPTALKTAQAFAATAGRVAREALRAALDQTPSYLEHALTRFHLLAAVGDGTTVFGVVGSRVAVSYATGPALARAITAMAQGRVNDGLPFVAAPINVLKHQPGPPVRQGDSPSTSGPSSRELDEIELVRVLRQSGDLTAWAGLSSSAQFGLAQSQTLSGVLQTPYLPRGGYLFRRGHTAAARQIDQKNRKANWFSVYADPDVQAEFVQFTSEEDATTGRFSLAGQVAFYTSLFAACLVELSSTGKLSNSVNVTGGALYAIGLLVACVVLTGVCLGVVLQRRRTLPQPVEAFVCFGCAALCFIFPLLSRDVAWLNSPESLASCVAPLLLTAMKRIPAAYLCLLVVGAILLPVIASDAEVAGGPEDVVLPAASVAFLCIIVLRGNCSALALATLFETMNDIRVLIDALEKQSVAQLDVLQAMYPEPIAVQVQDAIAASIANPDVHGTPKVWLAHPARLASFVSPKESLAPLFYGEDAHLDRRRVVDHNMVVIELRIRREDPLPTTTPQADTEHRFSYMLSTTRNLDVDETTALSGGGGYTDTHDVLSAIVLHFERFCCEGHLQVTHVVGDDVQVAGPFVTLNMNKKARAELPIAVAHAATRALLRLNTVLMGLKACAVAVCAAGDGATALVGHYPRSFVVVGDVAAEASELLAKAPELGTCAFFATDRFASLFDEAAYLAADEQERLTALVPHWMRSSGAWGNTSTRWKIRGRPAVGMRCLEPTLDRDDELKGARGL